jgi:ribonuclease HII
MPLPERMRAGVLEAGVDEAGRGCLAGPVVAAAVILPEGFSDNQLNDSKKIPEALRYKLRDRILDQALAWNIGIISAPRIDRINILNATFEAMHQALDKLAIKPEFILVDGNRFKPWNETEHLCIVKGDSKFASIAAASILAKTVRDDIMQLLHQEFPSYHWNTNKGYGTQAHVEAIFEFGQTRYHRKSFKTPAQLDLFKEIK